MKSASESASLMGAGVGSLLRLPAGSVMQIRRAVAREAGALSKLALIAKAHWGYQRAQLQVWNSSLEITAESISARPTFVADLDGQVIGFYSLVPSLAAWELDNLWVTPLFIRKGIGRALLMHAAQIAAERGATSILVDADPNAETFYVSCGATRVGAVSAPIAGESGRVRPQLVMSITRSDTA